MSEMAGVQYACIMNLYKIDFYVFSYSATGKMTEKMTEKGFGEFSCYISPL